MRTRQVRYDEKYGKYLLSDENIYLAIYSLRSYIFDFELLKTDDKERYYRLQDKFDESYIKNMIIEVKRRIKEVLENEDCFIKAEVYFKPKKLNGEGEVIYRPLHTTDIVSQIAIVAMLHLLVYEIPDDNNKLRLSNISRLLPENFYGNRVSLNPETLFKPWKQQYQAYTQGINESLKTYNESLEYKYEVSLDLENFFPTIDPMLVYQLIKEHLPVDIKGSDKALMEQLLIKLLFCRLKTNLSDKLRGNYYAGSGDSDELGKLGKFFVRGIPQGLPQSYFFGNICMIPISEIFQKEFQGPGFFYVDDSVIFTNDVDECQFNNQLKKINEEIHTFECDNIKPWINFRGSLSEFVTAVRDVGLYGIRVHGDVKESVASKSSFSRLDLLDSSEVYLKCISREVSQIGDEIFKLYSDEEDVALERRMEIISKEIKKKIDELDNKLEDHKEKEGVSEGEASNLRSNRSEQNQQLRKSRDRWIRYYRFFKYRAHRFRLRHGSEDGQKKEPEDGQRYKKYKSELGNVIYNEGSENKEKLKAFMQSYNEDIWDAAVGIYCEYADDKEKEKLGNYIREINTLCFGEENKTSSFLYKTYETLIEGETDNQDTCKRLAMDSRDSYKTLRYSAAWKPRIISNGHYEVMEGWVTQIQKVSWKEKILGELLSRDMLKIVKVVNENTQQLLRMVANAVYSQLFGVEMEDSFVIRKSNRKPLSYGEFRILLFLRNRLFREDTFLKQNFLLSDADNKVSLDYAIIEVAEIFRSFVKDPERIDKLIQAHQYTCAIWKNGSKHLYFYTLHNQEHAVILIKNIVKLIHEIDFLRITSLDFYLLFLACYFHDISMVRIPASDEFLTDKKDGDCIAWDYICEIDREKDLEVSDIASKSCLRDISQVKKWMVQSYRKLDEYFEKKIRGTHALESAEEIRNRGELSFLDPTVREFVAEISEAHQADERDIYFAKSSGTDTLINLKFDKILLRLADLLDMNSNRISRPILYHNIDQMSEESAFHWISHLLTQGYDLKTEYDIGGNKERLTPKSITERLVLTVYVDMSQISKYKCKKCDKMKIDTNTNRRGIQLNIGHYCDSEPDKCNFLCRWFVEKNHFLLNELYALKEYLNRVPGNYFETDIVVRIEKVNKTNLNARQFEILARYLKKTDNT